MSFPDRWSPLQLFHLLLKCDHFATASEQLLVMKRDWKPYAGFNDLLGILVWRMRIERRVTKHQLCIWRFLQTLWKHQGLHQHNQDQTGKQQNNSKAELLPLHLGNRLWPTQQGVKLYFLNPYPCSGIKKLAVASKALNTRLVLNTAQNLGK